MNRSILVLVVLALVAVASGQVIKADFSAQSAAFTKAGNDLVNAVQSAYKALSPSSQSGLTNFINGYTQIYQQQAANVLVNTQEAAKAITAGRLADYNNQILNQIG